MEVPEVPVLLDAVPDAHLLEDEVPEDGVDEEKESEQRNDVQQTRQRDDHRVNDLLEPLKALHELQQPAHAEHADHPR